MLTTGRCTSKMIKGHTLRLYSPITIKLGVFLPLAGVGLVAGHEVMNLFNVDVVIVKDVVKLPNQVIQGVDLWHGCNIHVELLLAAPDGLVGNWRCDGSWESRSNGQTAARY